MLTDVRLDVTYNKFGIIESVVATDPETGTSVTLPVTFVKNTAKAGCSAEITLGFLGHMVYYHNEPVEDE